MHSTTHSGNYRTIKGASMSRPARDPEITFWMRVSSSRDGCWEWLGSRFPNGYGLSWNGHETVGAHRYSWTLHFGLPPDGQYVLHRCDNRLCVRPDHLFLGSHADNMCDRNDKRRQSHGERHWNAQLDDEAVRQIRRLVASGYRQSKVARLFGVTKHTVCLPHGRQPL
jgi:hypothetical protein